MDKGKDGESELANIAKECLEKASGNWERAIRGFRRRLRERSAADRKRLLEALAECAMRYLVRNQSRRVRDDCFDAPQSRLARGTEGIDQMGKTQALDLLDVPLRGGLLFRFARKADLDAEAAFGRKISRTIDVRSTYYEAVSLTLPDGEKQVQDVFSNAQLVKILNRIERSKKKQ